MLLISVLIFVTDNRPIFLIQERVGFKNRNFKIIKFRTMRTNVPKYAIGLDSNKTTTIIGKLLRKFRIDEMPQFFNILLGQMSFVGPRPEINKHYQQYPKKYKIFNFYKPGLTSPATIIFRNEEEILKKYSDKELAYLNVIIPKKIATDLNYFKNSNVFSDFIVLLRTIFLVFKK